MKIHFLTAGERTSIHCSKLRDNCRWKVAVLKASDLKIYILAGDIGEASDAVEEMVKGVPRRLSWPLLTRPSIRVMQFLPRLYRSWTTTRTTIQWTLRLPSNYLRAKPPLTQSMLVRYCDLSCWTIWDKQVKFNADPQVEMYVPLQEPHWMWMCSRI